jgi:hypothetical protein
MGEKVKEIAVRDTWVVASEGRRSRWGVVASDVTRVVESCILAEPVILL